MTKHTPTSETEDEFELIGSGDECDAPLPLENRLPQDSVANKPSLPDNFEDDFERQLYTNDAVKQTTVNSSSQSRLNKKSKSSKDADLAFSSSAGSGTSYGRQLYTSLKDKVDWTSKEIIIAVLGMTGSGKTTFIQKVTGRTDLNVGHDLASCTQGIEVIECQLGSYTVKFIDTPGFGDTYRTDSEILQIIAEHLEQAYAEKVKLSGLIYLHPISDTRLTGNVLKNLKMFKSLCGNGNLKNVILATSMWDKVTVAEGARRETQLINDFWKGLLVYGARTMRHNGTLESARAITDSLLQNKPFYVQIQDELCYQNKALRDTSAGTEVMAELAKLKTDYQRELAEMREEIQKEKEGENQAVVESLEDYYKKLLRDMERTMRDERAMNEAAVRSLNERVMALEKNVSRCSIM